MTGVLTGAWFSVPTNVGHALQVVSNADGNVKSSVVTGFVRCLVGSRTRSLHPEITFSVGDRIDLSNNFN